MAYREQLNQPGEGMNGNGQRMRGPGEWARARRIRRRRRQRRRRRRLPAAPSRRQGHQPQPRPQEARQAGSEQDDRNDGERPSGRSAELPALRRQGRNRDPLQRPRPHRGDRGDRGERKASSTATVRPSPGRARASRRARRPSAPPEPVAEAGSEPRRRATASSSRTSSPNSCAVPCAARAAARAASPAEGRAVARLRRPAHGSGSTCRWRTSAGNGAATGAADGDLSAGHDLGVDAEVLVSPGAQQVRGDRHVAGAGGGIDVGRLAALRCARTPRASPGRCRSPCRASRTRPTAPGPRDRGWRESAADRPGGRRCAPARARSPG